MEDSENDAILLLNELRAGGYEPLFERVQSEHALIAALEGPAFDFIVSDFSMPQFNGARALAICQEKGLDVPFIVVSGRVGEEVAVAMMKAGAQDFITKDNLSRIVPAVTRELRAARERRGRKRAEAMAAHLASVVESCEDAIISNTLEGIVLSWNAAAEKIFGYGAEEMIGRSISILVPVDLESEQEQICRQIKRGVTINRLETLRLRKDRTVLDVSITVSPVKEIDGRIVGASLVARDVTQRRRADAERIRLIQKLTDALGRVKALSGLLPICAACKKIRNDEGYWEQVETYIKNRSNADFTHGICPDCRERLYPDVHIDEAPAGPAKAGLEQPQTRSADR